MSDTVNALAQALGLFLGILASLEVGRRIGLARLAREPEDSRTGLGAVEGAVYGLLGLLVAFSFSGAASRYDARRQLIVEEANAIGTAYLRLDLLPADAQASLKDKFRRYVDSRLEAYRRLPDVAAALAELAHSQALQQEIWVEAVVAARSSPFPPATTLLLPSLNQMFDITSTRTVAAQSHPPTIIFGMLGTITLVSALLVGNGMASSQRRPGLHMLAYAAVLAVVMFVIFDLEYPRRGFIRLDAFDRVLADVRRGMK